MATSLSALMPDLQPFARALVDLAGQNGLLPRVTSTLRTHSEQTRLYRDYLRGGRRYPAAPPGSSAHEYGAAFDMVVSPLDLLHELGRIWIDNGGVWSPRDEVHFEYPDWKSTVITTPELIPPWYQRHPPEWIEHMLKAIPGVGTVSELLAAVGVK